MHPAPIVATGLPPSHTTRFGSTVAMTSTTRGNPMRDHRSPVEVIREWRLPRAEREAAAAERRAESQLRRERDGREYSAARRAAAHEAEGHRGVGGWAGGGKT